MKVDANRIITKLMGWCRSSAYDVIIPNFFYGPFEMDVFRLMPSGYIVEYEVKISRSDFKADFQKNGSFDKDKAGDKHFKLKNGERISNRFFFVVPFQMILPEDVPDHAGLIYYRDDCLSVVKNAPLLHKQKTNLYKELAQRLSFREVVLRQKMRNYKMMYEDLQKRIRKGV